MLVRPKSICWKRHSDEVHIRARNPFCPFVQSLRTGVVDALSLFRSTWFSAGEEHALEFGSTFGSLMPGDRVGSWPTGAEEWDRTQKGGQHRVTTTIYRLSSRSNKAPTDMDAAHTAFPFKWGEFQGLLQELLLLSLVPRGGWPVSFYHTARTVNLPWCLSTVDGFIGPLTLPLLALLWRPPSSCPCGWSASLRGIIRCSPPLVSTSCPKSFNTFIGGCIAPLFLLLPSPCGRSIP